MKVAFNATSLLSPLTGIGQYSRHLAIGLDGRADIEALYFYGAIWSQRVRPTPMPGASRIFPWLRSNLPFSYAMRRALQCTQFTRQTASAHFDLYHEPNILPLPFDGPTILTVHDLSWIRHPEAHPAERVRAMNKYFPPGLERAARVLTDSDFVRRELMSVFAVPTERINVVPLGVEPLFRPCSAAQTLGVLQALGLNHGHYFLAVGTMEPRKNLEVALNAYSRLPREIRKHFPLVLAGMKGWNSAELDRRISTMTRNGEVRLLGYLPRPDLAIVIAGSTTLVFPSLYEGFGLPPLEAMACGVPVISSNAASMPEVIGETGVLLDPQDTDGMTQAMANLAGAPEERRRLGLLALERSKLFTWETCVDATVDAYYQTLNIAANVRSTPKAPIGA